jgi:hypothetical protein
VGWQDAVAIAVVFGAIFYLSSLAWGGLIGKRQSSCGTSCGKCSSGDATIVSGRPEQVVSIGLGRVGASGQAAPQQPQTSKNP